MPDNASLYTLGIEKAIFEAPKSSTIKKTLNIENFQYLAKNQSNANKKIIGLLIKLISTNPPRG